VHGPWPLAWVCLSCLFISVWPGTLCAVLSWLQELRPGFWLLGLLVQTPGVQSLPAALAARACMPFGWAPFWLLWTWHACAVARNLVCPPCLALCLSLVQCFGRLISVRYPAGSRHSPVCVHAVSCGPNYTAGLHRWRDVMPAAWLCCCSGFMLVSFALQLGSLDWRGPASQQPWVQYLLCAIFGSLACKTTCTEQQLQMLHASWIRSSSCQSGALSVAVRHLLRLSCLFACAGSLEWRGPASCCCSDPGLVYLLFAACSCVYRCWLRLLWPCSSCASVVAFASCLVQCV
jgi:hypothetical protein